MRIGVPKETAAGEHRVALVPEVIAKLTAKGIDISVQRGAGEGALLDDDAFTKVGAEITDDAHAIWSCDAVVTIAPPDPQAIRGLGQGSVLIGFLAPLTSPQTIRALAEARATALAMEAIPRISRAQSMDALSSQSNVAGYRAALLGAQELGRFYPMLMTAAGTIPPAKVLVLGVGVAGLQAIATAKRLGARTTGYDVRPEVAEQVESLGAQWLDLGLEASGEGGYARELTEQERARQQQALTEAIGGFDVVITTALVPGRPAPRLVTAEAVRGDEGGIGDHRPRGRGRRQLRAHRAGPDGRPSPGQDRLAAEPARDDGRARLAAVRPQRARAAGTADRRGRHADARLRRRDRQRRLRGARRRDRQRRRPRRRRGRRVILASVLTTNLAILVLAGFIGFVVISKVPNTLHTPLMSGTNAIHGIVLLGGLLLIGLSGNDTFNKVILVIAIVFGTINIVGGFLVTDRMLEMFKTKPKPKPREGEDEQGRGAANHDGAAGDQLPADGKLHLRPLHRRLLAVHPGPARARRADHGGARQPHRRRRHGDRGHRHAAQTRRRATGG